MLIRRTTAALACALLLGAPATAIAQSAGDNQYFDPVGPDEGGGSSSNGGDSSGGTTSPAPAPAPTTTPSGTSSSAAPAPAATAPAAPVEGTAATPGELPRTGGDPLIVALFGAAMLLTGAGSRLLVVRDPR